MAEEHPSYDKANHLKTNNHNWEAQSIRGVESEYPENDKHGVDEDEAEAAEGYQVARPHQEQSASSSSGSTISSSIDSTSTTSTTAAIKTPPSPTSPAIGDASRPGVRFTDRGPPRTSTGHLPAVHRRSGSGAGVGVVEWGMLFDENGYATARSNQFLRGLAKYIIDDLAPGSNDLVITPEKLCALYSRYRLNPEIYPFIEILNSRARDVHERLADFFTDLDCQYHLVPPNAYSRPRVPGLTPAGFVRYFTTCVLAHPDEEFRRLDRIAADVQLVADAPAYAYADTGTGTGKGVGTAEPERLPRQLFRSQFPVRNDPRSKKVLAAALDDLMYDLRLLEPGSPRSSLALMPPSTRPPALPPPPQGTKDRSSAIVPIIRRYVFPERRGDGYSSSKHAETGRYNDDEEEEEEEEERKTYRDREQSRYYIGKQLSRYQIASSGSNSNHNHNNHASHRARSPPPRTRPFRASAPNIVSSSGSGSGSGSGSSSFRSAGYLPAPPAPAPAAYSPTDHAQRASGRRQSSGGRIEAVHTTSTTASAPAFPPPGEVREQDEEQDEENTALGSTAGEKRRHRYSGRLRRYSATEERERGRGRRDGEDDKGPTWAEVLRAPSSGLALGSYSQPQPHAHQHHHQQHHHHDHSHHSHHGHNHGHHHHHHRAEGSSSKEGGKSHHHHHARHHSSH
ncbi:uncharacterized protein F4812DRAFT_467366 [Daldinia caldariorum]|uniref:uncharacterized protein n=1 Tax=Daldinia caldariorum TaxID=326644 RepID=UPI0020074EE8|nr:uncharacterized protein F4812DRAFT_467366 [Daldinia caldariorum]KAI1471189.1 hypothetical protein F4812DRAFT_467366 [Daldinia caldariorum]